MGCFYYNIIADLQLEHVRHGIKCIEYDGSLQLLLPTVSIIHDP